MAKRKLTEEEIAEIAKREWKPQRKITVHKIGDVNNPEKLAIRIGNLSGPKTEEGKKNSLKNLIVGRHDSQPMPNLKHGGYIKKVLDKQEQVYYDQRKQDYLRDYDINNSADEILLNLALMDEVIIYRLYMRQADKPSLDISRPLTEAQNRLQKTLDSLGMLRKQRINQDQKTTAITIATLAEMVARDKRKIQEEILRANEEEEEYLRQVEKRKKLGESSEVIDVEAVDVPPKEDDTV